MRGRWPNSIRTQLVALVLGVALPTFGVLVWGFWSEVRREHADARELALRIARSRAEDLRDSNERARALLVRMAERPKIREASAGDCDTLFAIIDFFPQYLNLLLFDARGSVICSATPAPSDAAYSAFAQSAVSERLRASGASTAEPLVLTKDRRWIWVAFQSTTSGVLALVQSLDLDVDAYPQGTVVTITDLEGRIVARSHEGERWIGRKSQDSVIDRLMQTHEEGLTEAVGVDGVRRQYGFKRVPGTEWSVRVGVPSGVAMASVRGLMLHGLAAGALMLIVVMLLAIRLARAIERPLDDLARAAARVGEAGFGDEVPVGGPNEIATVGESFNRMTSRRAEAERALEESHAQLEALSKKLLDVQEDERSRISREIHDEMGQLLTALNMDVGGLLRAAEPLTAEQQAMATRIRTALAETISSVQRIAAELRPPALDDFGLVAAIESEARTFEERTAIECDLSLPDSLALGADADAAVYRIVQEAMTNVARHAEAARLEIRSRVRGDELVIEIRDDGKGITADEMADRKSLGIAGMRERARSIGATLEVEGVRGRGTIVSIRVALPRTDAARRVS